MPHCTPFLVLLSFAVASSAWAPCQGQEWVFSERRDGLSNMKLGALSSNGVVGDWVQQERVRGVPQTRRNVLASVLLVSACSATSLPAYALVKGNAPPTKMKPMGDKPKCTNIEECLSLAEQKQQAEIEEIGQLAPPKTTGKGTRYLDLETGSGQTVRDGSEVELLYKVLKLGKRSYDGLSGEGTVVFSRGYGLEDDEKEPGQTTFTTTVGAIQNIAAFNDAVVGMNKGGVRRFAVLPQQGWERATRVCDGGPGGMGAGGDLKTDYVVVPTATMVATEACLDTSKQPFPASYAQRRRMAQRFDQSLIMEVQVVDIREGA